MEPLTVAATAVASTMITKALEKTGEKIGERVFEQSEKFLTSLKLKSPETAIAIQSFPQAPLDFGQAILEVDALTKTDPEVAEEVRLLTETVEQDADPRLAEIVQAITDTLNDQKPTVQNMGKLAEKIGLVVQGGNVSIQNLTVD